MNNEKIQLIKNSRYLCDLPDQLLNTFAELINPLVHQKGDVILEQGAYNDRIFFLFSGELGIFLDGEQLMTIRRLGDVFGEMSVINNNPVSADVIAVNAVKTFCLQIQHLKTDALHIAEIDFFLQRVFTRILVDKLSLSSHQAKQFQETNRLLKKEREKTQILVKNREQEYEQLCIAAESLADANDRYNETMKELENKKQQLETEVSERETTETELNLYKTMLEKLVADTVKARDHAINTNAAKSLFLANMSHEIRTPLTAIIGFAETLLDVDLDETARDNAVQTIVRNGAHLLSLINEILDLSKIEANKLVIEKLPISPFELLDDIKALLLPRVQAGGLEFEITYEFPLPAQIMTDPTRLRQIIINLCNNAIKFTEKGKVQLILAFDSLTKKVKFSVIDTGIGLTEEQIGRLFGQFEQADSSTTRRYGGSGLGLHISQRLAGLLGGNIIVNSAYGQGTQFDAWIDAGVIKSNTLVHTLADINNNNQTTAQNNNTIPNLRGHILVVDDEPDNQKLIAYLLQKAGLTADIAENGKIAVEKALAGDYQLVLMDMNMPIMSGDEAVQTLIKLGYSTPIIALTGSVMLEEQQHCRQIGCREVLAKPLNKKRFYQILECYLKTDNAQPAPKIKTVMTANKLTGQLLLVEDNKENQRLMFTLLKRMGLTAELAVNGKEAVKMAEVKNYDLILMDIQMPIMNGEDATYALRQLGYQQPIVACTANVMVDDKERYIAAGCNDVIAKPINRQQFTQVLKKFLGAPNKTDKTCNCDGIEGLMNLSAKIMVAEESGPVYSTVVDTLTKTQIEVNLVQNSDVFVEQALENTVDLFLLDMQMLGMEEAVCMLTELGNTIPALAFIPDGGDQKYKKIFDKIECFGVFSTPIDTIRLKTDLTRHLNSLVAMTAKTFDESAADAEYDETYTQLCREFLTGLPQRLQNINRTINDEDWQALKDLLHSLKGSAGNFGHPEITKLAAKAELMLKHREYPRVFSMITALHKYCKGVYLNESPKKSVELRSVMAHQEM